MVNKKSVGRPPKVDYKVMSKLEDALHYGVTVSEACIHAGISRDTFYRHLNNNFLFAKKIVAARNKCSVVEWL